jgi:hypothetical protein
MSVLRARLQRDPASDKPWHHGRVVDLGGSVQRGEAIGVWEGHVETRLCEALEQRQRSFVNHFDAERVHVVVRERRWVRAEQLRAARTRPSRSASAHLKSIVGGA